VTHQLLGAPDDRSRKLLAEALVQLGVERAWVVRSVDGLDEVSPFAETRVTEVRGGSLRSSQSIRKVSASKPARRGAIAGGEPEANARALLSIFNGEPHPAADAIALNAAAALVVAQDMSPEAAGAKAREVLASRRALGTLEAWRKAAASRVGKAR
jgi:anthranilate phosphoribosyltransferase